MKKEFLLSKRAAGPKKFEWENTGFYWFLPKQNKRPPGYIYKHAYILLSERQHQLLKSIKNINIDDYMDFFESEGNIITVSAIPILKQYLDKLQKDISFAETNFYETMSDKNFKYLKRIFEELYNIYKNLLNTKRLDKDEELEDQEKELSYSYDKKNIQSHPEVISLTSEDIDTLSQLAKQIGWNNAELEISGSGGYVSKFVTDNFGRKVRISKLFNEIEKAGFDNEIKSIKRQYEIGSQGVKWNLYISADPHDIKAASFCKGWGSCIGPEGTNYSSLDKYISQGDMIAYGVVDGEDDWECRCILRYDGQGGWWPEKNVYGVPKSRINFSDFLAQVELYLKEKNIFGKVGQFSRFSEGWSDYIHGKLEDEFFKSDIEEEEENIQKYFPAQSPEDILNKKVTEKELLKSEFPTEKKFFILNTYCSSEDCFRLFKKDALTYFPKLKTKIENIEHIKKYKKCLAIKAEKFIDNLLSIFSFKEVSIEEINKKTASVLFSVNYEKSIENCLKRFPEFTYDKINEIISEKPKDISDLAQAIDDTFRLGTLNIRIKDIIFRDCFNFLDDFKHKISYFANDSRGSSYPEIINIYPHYLFSIFKTSGREISDIINYLQNIGAVFTYRDVGSKEQNLEDGFINWIRPKFMDNINNILNIVEKENLTFDGIRKSFKAGSLVSFDRSFWAKLDDKRLINLSTKDFKDQPEITKVFGDEGEEVNNILKNGGSVVAPIILKTISNNFVLVSGNTELCLAKINHIKPMVWLINENELF